MSSSKWSGCREEEYSVLGRLIESRVPVVHLQGPHGSGKTTILQDLLAEKHHVFVDGNLSTSVSSLMTCIIRRIATYRSILPMGSPTNMEMSDDQSMGQRSVKSFKKEELSTPGSSPAHTSLVPSRAELLNNNPRRMRDAAVKAMAGIARVGTGVRRRKQVDSDEDFLDEDSSEESDNGSDDSGATGYTRGVSVGRTRHLVKSSLSDYGQFRVRNESGFLQKLERLMLRQKDISEPFYLVIDNVDSLPSGSESFLGLFGCLSEYLGSGRSICAVFTSTKLLPVSLSGKSATLSLHPYSLGECQSILSRELGCNSEGAITRYASAACTILYPSMRNNFRLLRDSILRMVELEPSLAPSKAIVNAKAAAADKISDLFNDENGGNVPSVRWLSLQAKRVLLAGYLAAHNPATQDKHIFKVVCSRTSKREVSSFKNQRAMADAIDIRAPAPFPIGRLLHIYRFLTGDFDEESKSDGGFAFYRTVNELVHFGLFKGAATRLSCHTPFELVSQVADHVGVRLDEVLYA